MTSAATAREIRSRLQSRRRWHGGRRHDGRRRRTGIAGTDRIPTSTVDLNDPEAARKVLNLVERLDNHDDVQSVSSNFNIPDEALAQIA